ncbi:MAG: N-acetylneuraminate synthase [Desulfobacula sp.]|uniref:N-acetylneuraminate synthase n=1 Tax=Desulfobacula sp. TaxID=2593537 RepID=UPI0025C26405|nr:N-acetylneuraminate synthase [Desulfobacula sp.]MCD4722126.1 N-acetylneuraminate synthase [Desulfobacula sp.]
MNKVFIIAEAGVNHNGNIKTAEKMIDIAVKAGADAVKFQTFQARELCCVSAEKAEYQKKNGDGKETQFEMLKRLELDDDAHNYLISYCKKQGITFLSSPFDLKSIELLSSLGMKIFKIPSGEITNVPYLEKIGSLGKKIILSTGMADMEEIEFALDVLINTGTLPNDITLLHCCSQYPAPMDDVNLLAMKSMAKSFPGVKIGYSDHTQGIEVAIAAVAMGASVIEKHFTLDRTMDGPDHVASIEPDELKGMVCAIRNIEKAMGDGEKKAQSVETANKRIVRKSIVAQFGIKKGEIFTSWNLAVKRPGNGLSPVKWYEVLGKKAKKDFLQDEQITL